MGKKLKTSVSWQMHSTNFSVSVASNLKGSIENSNLEKLKIFCEDRVPDGTVFPIPEISREKYEKFFKLIDVSKGTGCDDIGPHLLKLAAPYIAESATYICNQSIKLSQFPEK